MNKFIPLFNCFTQYTPTTPKLYWHTMSQEQRIAQILFEFDRLIAYCEECGIQINKNTEEIEKLAEKIAEIDARTSEEALEAFLAEWLEQHISEYVEPYELPAATATILGGIKKGNGFKINDDGTAYILGYNGITVARDGVQANIDTAMGLMFNGSKTAIKLGEGLDFDEQGAIYVTAAPVPTGLYAEPSNVVFTEIGQTIDVIIHNATGAITYINNDAPCTVDQSGSVLHLTCTGLTAGSIQVTDDGSGSSVNVSTQASSTQYTPLDYITTANHDISTGVTSGMAYEIDAEIPDGEFIIAGYYDRGSLKTNGTFFQLQLAGSLTYTNTFAIVPNNRYKYKVIFEPQETGYPKIGAYLSEQYMQLSQQGGGPVMRMTAAVQSLNHDAKAGIKIYSYKVWGDDFTLTHQLKPVLRNSDGVEGFLNERTGVFSPVE